MMLYVNIYAFVESEGNLWFIPQECNALCRYNQKEKYIDYMTVVPDEGQRPTLYSQMIVYEKYLVLIPHMASEVAIFDTQKLQFQKVQLPIPSDRYLYRESVKFHSGIRKGKLIYLLPGEFPEILCINMEEMKTASINIWYPLYNGIDWGKEKAVGAYKGIDKLSCLDGNELYITFYAGEKGRLGKFSFDTNEIEIFSIDGIDTYFSCMEMYGDDLYLVTRSGQIIRWNRKSHKVVGKYSYEIAAGGMEGVVTSYEIFIRSILYQETLYLFWADKPQYTEFDLNSHKMTTHLFRYIDMPIRDLCFSEENIYFLTNESNSFYQWIDGGIKKYSFSIGNELLMKYFFEGYFQNKDYFKESNWFDLNKMLPILSNMESVEDKVRSDVGKTIYYYES